VLVNNRAEGNAPLTVQALAEMLSDHVMNLWARILKTWEG